jgi:hypothetical protein
MIKSFQPIDNICSHNGKKERPSWFEQVTVEDCNNDLVQMNKVVNKKAKRLLKDMTRINGKSDA